ncbi:MAG: diguanylate cyclase [Eubacterium sp.]|nr:diguanylate cyclase [Eubacterium sp.]
MSENKTSKRRSLVVTLIQIGVIPILLLGIGLTVYSQYSVREGMDYEMERALSGIAHNILSTYNALDGGEFSMKGEDLYKGEKNITADYRILDDLKNDTGNDVTIYYGDKRRMTTIVDDKGNRLTGTDAPEGVIDHVYGQKEEYFSTDVDIQGVPYYGYYVPIRNDAGDIIGMTFAGKPKDSVMLSTHYMVVGNILISIFAILLAAFILYLASSKMVVAIQHIRRFLGKLAGGDFTQKMPDEVLKRKDELAEMGEYAVHVEIALDDMISRDPLTKLLNRRATMVRVENTWENCDFAIAMGDIDWFKGVNDNYGHDMGDEVLKFVAGELKDELEKSGFVARWGGEEFLIGFDGTQEELVSHLKAVTGRIRAKVFDTGEKTFSVTMTMGVTIKQPGEEFEVVMNRADNLLYKGKRGGRNQIVVDGEELDGIPEGIVTE